MRKTLIPFALAVVVILGVAATTVQRGVVSTSAFWRDTMTNEDWLASLNSLHISPSLTNYNWSFIGPSNTFVIITSNTNFAGTLNGGTLTNITATNIVGTIPTLNFPTNVPIYTNVPFGSVGYYNGSNWVTTTNLVYTNSSLLFLYGNVIVAQVASNGILWGNGSGITNISAISNIVGVLPTNNVTKNAPSIGSFVHYRSGGNSNYTATTNITFDGSILVITNQGSAQFASITTNGNVLATGYVSETGPLTNSSISSISTNVAPLAVTLNPLTSGLIYTTPLQRGSVSASCVYSNGSMGWLTNLTTHQVRLIGGVNYLGTNVDTKTIRTSPGDQVSLTNVTGLILIQSSDYTGE